MITLMVFFCIFAAKKAFAGKPDGGSGLHAGVILA
jgi:hypothetical protein